MADDPRPLLVTDDAALLDDILRLAAAADVEIEAVHAAVHARRSWPTAPLVLVGADLADEMGRVKPCRRDGVLLFGDDPDATGIWHQAVALGAEHVIFLPGSESWLVDRMADAVEGDEAEADTVCVLGGRGGAGASTLAAALALTGSRKRLRTLLVDGDPLGGGLDLVLGSEGSAGSRWSDFAGTRGRVSGAALRGALPRVGELLVLSGQRDDSRPVPVEAMRSVLAAARRGSDLVVADLPRHLDDAAKEALADCTTALLIVPAEVRATVAAARVAASAAEYATDLRVVVRRPAPSGLSAAVVAHSLGLPLAGEVRNEPGLPAAMDRGEAPARHGRGPLADFCGAYLGVRPGSAEQGTAA